MKKLATLLGFVAISLTANAEVQLTPSQTKYCSQKGSEMTIRYAGDSKFKIFLKKNGMSFTLLAPISGITLGGEVDIKEKQDLLISNNLIANGVLVKTTNSYDLSTLSSNESTIKASNTLSEITVASGIKMGVLYSNGGLIFIGAESLCP